MESLNQKKVGSIAIVAPVVFMQIALIFISLFFIEFVLSGLELTEYGRLVNAVVWAVILFPELLMYPGKKLLPFVKIGIGARIIPYMIYFGVIIQALSEYYGKGLY